MVAKYHLEELKNIFNQEYQRKESLETKSSYMLAISSILLTIFVDIIITIVSSDNIVFSNLLILFSTIFVVFSVISILCCMINVSVLILKFPWDTCSIKNINQLDESELYDELYENYMVCINENLKKIDKKIYLLNIVYVSNFLMILSLLLIVGYLFVFMG